MLMSLRGTPKIRILKSKLNSLDRNRLTCKLGRARQMKITLLYANLRNIGKKLRIMCNKNRLIQTSFLKL